MEHTRLQPSPLGWAEGLGKEVAPDQCTFIPPVSRPPGTRQDLMGVVLGVKPAWADTQRELAVILNHLADTLKQKMRRVPTGGIILVSDRAILTWHAAEVIARAMAEVVESTEFDDFATYSTILLNRANNLQYFSALIQRRTPMEVQRAD